MSQFIPKKVLTEGMAANPLDKGVAEEQDITALAQEGILTAAAAETDAINQYMQILDMVDRSEPWLGNLVKPTLEDIVSEEKKHFAQLSTIVSKLPAFEKEFEMGTEEAETGEDKSEEAKEEVEESVATKSSEEYNKYDLDTIIKIVTEETTITSDYLYDNADAYNYIEVDGLYPQQVDDFLSLFTFNPETLEKIEQRIIAEADIEANKAAEQKADEEEMIKNDIDSLQALVEDEDDIHYLKHPEIRQKVWDIISEYTKID
jgi:rubrerythrin